MTVIVERARAKINLTLRVLGRRPDGYHELESLVAFADVGDVVTLDTCVPTDAGPAGWTVTVSGPFAGALARDAGDNLITTTLQLLAKAYPALQLGAVHLDKQLPVAAGIGGGSADAAAVLRAVRRANAGITAGETVDWARIAASLGADVPVCFANTSAWMQGIGDRLQPVPDLPGLHAVLVNALGAVPADKTARVFRALNAAPWTASSKRPADTDATDGDNRPADASPLGTGEFRAEGVVFYEERCRALLALMRAHGNSLVTATQHVVPEVTDVLRTLNLIAVELDGPPKSASPKSAGRSTKPRRETHVAMSGAGPTCFIVVPSAAEATAVAATLRSRQPTWWVAATQIGGEIIPSSLTDDSFSFSHPP